MTAPTTTEECSAAAIEVRGVSYAYPGSEIKALDGVDLTFRSGEMTAVLGRNGSGKSTLARLTNGLILPSEGSVLSCGHDISAGEGRSKVHRCLAMVFQNPDNQMVGTTVEEEVAFGPENLGLKSDEIRRRVDDKLALAGITDLKLRQPLRLSQGQKQLVAISGALAMEPTFLVSDESTSMLDHSARLRIVELFIELKRAGMGVIHVTHFLEEAALADRVVILEKGSVAAEGTPAEVLCSPERVRALGLDPLAVTVVAEELRASGSDVPPGILTVEELLSWLSS